MAKQFRIYEMCLITNNIDQSLVQRDGKICTGISYEKEGQTGLTVRKDAQK